MIGLGNNKRLYINHHLSRELLQVKDKSLGLKRRNVIQKVNARYNAVRIVINNTAHKVYNINELGSIIKQETGQDMDTILAQQLETKQ